MVKVTLFVPFAVFVSLISNEITHKNANALILSHIQGNNDVELARSENLQARISSTTPQPDISIQQGIEYIVDREKLPKGCSPIKFTEQEIQHYENLIPLFYPEDQQQRLELQFFNSGYLRIDVDSKYLEQMKEFEKNLNEIVLKVFIELSEERGLSKAVIQSSVKELRESLETKSNLAIQSQSKIKREEYFVYGCSNQREDRVLYFHRIITSNNDSAKAIANGFRSEYHPNVLVLIKENTIIAGFEAFRFDFGGGSSNYLPKKEQKYMPRVLDELTKRGYQILQETQSTK